ncbi:hypothetical protein [Halorubrum ezzemoulense]|uniref:hypothetical protein n=1 Tax=Halorubrum ezzemoulense TaxID=337243 RepID=UPI00232F4641|nr:hypothetical protein [Halorubrum ezzemoulense]MDB2239131.1 hypothetical protein [Halorubrum ezzemoulense]MDB2249684.1 hypothetical protein [Halorubrum ezzemoulense]
MPVLHEYENDTGVYLRSNIDGTFVTFQVYRSAARLFSRIGYKDGSVIGWEFLKPLWERGYIYTGNSGTTNKVETHLEGQKLDLKGNEKEELEQFLEKQKRESITVPEDIYSTLLDWHNGKYSKQRARDLLYQANNEQICRTSIREFSQSPIEVTGIETSKGDPAYDVISKGYEMRCVDVRESGQETNLIITYRGESGHAHGLFLNDGDLRQWKIYSSEGVSDEQYHDLLKRFPAICELLVDVPHYDLRLEDWDFDDASHHSIPGDIVECLQLDWAWCVYSIGRSDGESTHLSGSIGLISSFGYGVVETDELKKGLVFGSTDKSLSENQDVTFKFQRKDGRMRAKELEPSEEVDNLGGRDGKTKYGRQFTQRKEARRRAEWGELDWSEGVITHCDHSTGHGYVKLKEDRETLYFTLNALSDQSLSKSDSVRVVVSEGKKRALLLEPNGSDGPDESDESAEEENQTEARPLEVGERRSGWLRYLNRYYGSLAVDDCPESLLFRSNKLPIRPEQASLGMAFSFEVAKNEGGLRASDLQRKPEKDHSSDDDLELIPGSEDTGDDIDSKGTRVTTPVDEETTRWVTRNVTEATKVFDSIKLADDFGVDVEEYEDSIKTFGYVDDFEIDDLSISDKGHPVYQFALDDGYWRVEHCITRQETVLDIFVCPADSPHHQARVVDGNLVSWRPKFDQGTLTDEARHKYVLEQGQYAEMVDTYLSTIH